MRFFKLTHPQYRTDAEEEARNPVMYMAPYHLPGVICDACGPWSSSARLRIPPSTGLNEFLGTSFMQVSDWQRARSQWAQTLNVSADELSPGAELGPPMGICKSRINEDTVHPLPGVVWVTSRVRGVLIMASFTGMSFVGVQLSASCEVDMWELVVHGRASRKGSTLETLRLCDICGRTGFPSPKNLSVDEARWDGSDFVIVDDNPNMILVSERVKNTIDASGITNLAVSPTD